MTIRERGLAVARRGWRLLRSARAWHLLGARLSSPRVVIQLTAVVVGAVLAGVVAVQDSAASGTWQQAIREESKRSGLLQELVRAVYEDEAPQAFRAAAAQARANALSGLTATSQLASAERVVSTQIAFTVPRRSPAS